MLWHGIREELVALSIGVNRHFYSAGKFAFGFVFHHSTNSAGGFIPWVVVMMIQVSGILPLGFCFVPDFIGLFMLSLSVVCGVFGFGCGDLFWILYFLELPALETRRFGAWKGFWWVDFKKLSTRLVKQIGSSVFLHCCCCCCCGMFIFFSIMAREMNTHSNQTTLLLFFDTQSFWFGC